MMAKEWLDQFFRITDKGRLKRGRALYQSGRLVEFRSDERKNRFYASVQGSRAQPYQVRGHFSAKTEEGWPDLDELFITCSCPDDWVEFCKHSICAVIHYAHRFEQPESMFSFYQQPADASIHKIKKQLATRMSSIETLGAEAFFDDPQEFKNIHAIVRRKIRELKTTASSSE